MSEKPEQPPQNKGGWPNPTPPDRYQPKVLLIFLLIFGAILALWTMNPGNQIAQPENLSIHQVVGLAERGEIESATIFHNPAVGGNWVEISGKMRSLDKNTSQNFFASGTLLESDLQTLRGYGISEKLLNTFWVEAFRNLLFFALIFGLIYFFVIRQMKMAGKGAMSFGKSRARMMSRDRMKITFADVAGCDEAKEEVSEIVDFLRDPRKFQKIGGRIPKGVLMVGPPGTGKTLLAKAVAGEADVPFFSISGSDFVEMFVGVGAARVRDMFEQGKKNAPCLIFIDEIDAVGRQRGAGVGGGNDEREQTLNSMLVEMDGIDGHEGVIIIAATNRPDVLDSALKRPGRFDRTVMIDLPDVVGREAILKVHAKKIKLSPAVDLQIVAQATPGLSGADLANLLNESALVAARYNKEEVSMAEIEEAREKIAFGRERRKVMDENDKKIVAWHEAGHAVVQALLDDGTLPVHKVTIIPRGASLGSTMFLPTKETYNYSKKFMLKQIASLMGGRIAEDLVFADITSGASGDIKQATKIARHMVCEWGMSDLGPVALDDNQENIFLGREIARSQNHSEQTAERIDREIRRIIDEQYQLAETLLKERREALDKIAEALLKYETIDGKHVQEILEFGEIRSPVVPSPSAKAFHDKVAKGNEIKPDEQRGKAQDNPEGAGGETAPAPV